MSLSPRVKAFIGAGFLWCACSFAAPCPESQVSLRETLLGFLRSPAKLGQDSVSAIADPAFLRKAEAERGKKSALVRLGGGDGTYTAFLRRERRRAPSPAREMSYVEWVTLAEYAAGGLAYGMNEALRRGMITFDLEKRVLISALARLEGHRYEGMAYRMIDTDTAAELEAVAARYRPGQFITEAAFVSAGTDLNGVKTNFGGDVLFRIHSRTGKRLKNVVPSVRSGEGEVLFPAGTRFQVLKASPASGSLKLEIELLEVGS